jgi:hypothetical protein
MIDHVVWAQIDDIESRISAWFRSVHGFVSFLFSCLFAFTVTAVPPQADMRRAGIDTRN